MEQGADAVSVLKDCRRTCPAALAAGGGVPPGGGGGRRFDHAPVSSGGPFAPSGAGGQWGYLLELVWREYAYCTMHGVNIVDGAIVSCENIQRSLTFGPAGEAADPAPAFDDYWRALQTLCGGIGTGRLAELRFSRGRPVSARTSEGGRRFKRLLRKDS